MARRTFGDTSGFYSLLVKKDSMHNKASGLLSGAARTKDLFVTTDYVLDETATLLKARGYMHLLPKFFDAVFSSKACNLEWMDPSRFANTRSLFLKQGDHAWSFTDCFSFVVMNLKGLLLDADLQPALLQHARLKVNFEHPEANSSH